MFIILTKYNPGEIMQFNRDFTDQSVYINSYDSNKKEITITNYITQKKNTYTKNLVVLNKEIITDWPLLALTDLDKTVIKQIIELNTEIVILGIGSALIQLEFEVLEPLYVTKTPFEVMTTTNACRTFNLLASEHRQVAAVLFI